MYGTLSMLPRRRHENYDLGRGDVDAKTLEHVIRSCVLGIPFVTIQNVTGQTTKLGIKIPLGY